MRRTTPVRTVVVQTPSGPLTIPTLPELIGMKATMAYRRKAVRDFVDFAALSQIRGDEPTLDDLMDLDRVNADEQSGSLSLEVAKALVEAMPTDLDAVDLSSYRGLTPEWQPWERTALICRSLGLRLGERLVETKP